MKLYYTIFLLLLTMAMGSLAPSEPNYTVSLAPAEIRDKQLTNRQKYESARKILQQALSTGNKALAEKAIARFQEILDEAGRDPQAVSAGIILATRLGLGLLYVGRGGADNFAEAEKVLLPVTQATPESAVDAEFIVQACGLAAQLKTQGHNKLTQDTLIKNEELHRKILYLAALYPSLTANEEVRFQINLAKLWLPITLYESDPQTAIRYYREASDDLAQRPFPNPGMARATSFQLERTKKILQLLGYKE